MVVKIDQAPRLEDHIIINLLNNDESLKLMKTTHLYFLYT